MKTPSTLPFLPLPVLALGLEEIGIDPYKPIDLHAILDREFTEEEYKKAVFTLEQVERTNSRLYELNTRIDALNDNATQSTHITDGMIKAYLAEMHFLTQGSKPTGNTIFNPKR
ncbi:hypothetical protein F0267_17330 [Vibrio coralliilyticus]|uniref:Uncharacterized protein n=1 Tax=Vibrio coralliilyticus TaxID=190893 RepID=A0AAN0SBB2_9VIBR|nr:hypothetical protein [Vibrio coralliilyticus]AIW18700.1 hypothetical protein IX92_06415 [Vibrio coralliilyticus]NOH39983.1 hypothetical protein [Vibrio coralliilyticus]